MFIVKLDWQAAANSIELASANSSTSLFNLDLLPCKEEKGPTRQPTLKAFNRLPLQLHISVGTKLKKSKAEPG